MDRKKKNTIIGISIAIIVLLVIIAIVVPIACVYSQKEEVKNDIKITNDQQQNIGQADKPGTETPQDKVDNDTTNDKPARVEGYHYNEIDLSKPQTFNATDLNNFEIYDLTDKTLNYKYYCLFIETKDFKNLSYSIESDKEIKFAFDEAYVVFIKENVKYADYKTYIINLMNEDDSFYRDQMAKYMTFDSNLNPNGSSFKTNTDGHTYAMLFFSIAKKNIEVFENHKCQITISKFVS